MNQEFLDVHIGFRKGRGNRDQIASIHWIIEKAKKEKAQKKTWKEMGVPDHLTCLLRNLYAGQDTTVKTGHGTTDWFQPGKDV